MEALSGMRALNQWFIWRLEWDDEQDKYIKTPCYRNGGVFRMDARKPENWMSYADAVGALNELPKSRELQYALGFWFTRECGYWFLDIDKASEDGEMLRPFAQQMVDAFPGAFVEWSSSGKGVHVIGALGAPLDRHRVKPEAAIKLALAPLELEFYTEGRGIAFGLSGVAQGDADTRHDAMIDALVDQYFPYVDEGEGDFEVARADWRGPIDDDELIRRALNAKESAAVAFGGKASFAQLWEGKVEHNSEHDMALASHLAFWTGCDAPRIEQLMWRSGMVRDKWKKHRTYLMELTIQRACASCERVYQEPVRDTSAAASLMIGGPLTLSSVSVSPQLGKDVREGVRKLRDAIGSCGSEDELFDVVIPMVQEFRIPLSHFEAVAGDIKARLKLLGGDMPIAQIRTLIRPGAVVGLDDAPLWVRQHVYVQRMDRFMDLDNGALKSAQGFAAEFTKVMPRNSRGGRDNPAQVAVSEWGMATVNALMYRPDMEPIFEWEGLTYANLYSPRSLPVVPDGYSEAGVRGVEAFRAQLWDICAHREDVYMQLLSWFAHNVQFPGVKIRWSPLIKGCQGDGKTLITEVVRAAMGPRNAGITDNGNLSNKGGFTDWMVGKALNIIEEIWLNGKEKYKLYNTMKAPITNNTLDINSKGDKSYSVWNCTNHGALSNHNDALPLAEDDRRWMIVFSPWDSLQSMMAYCGIDEEQWRQRKQAMDYAKGHCQGELRKWFMEIPLYPAFDRNDSAPRTPERYRMIATGKDDIESIVASILDEGAPGITKEVFSHTFMANQIKMIAAATATQIPYDNKLHHIYTRLGYVKHEGYFRVKGKQSHFWLKNGRNYNVEEIKEIMAKT